MPVEASPPSLDIRVEQILQQMSLEEKVGQMTQIDITVICGLEDSENCNDIDPEKLHEAIHTYHVGSILNSPFQPTNRAQSIETWHKIMRAIDTEVERSRLKIPVIYGIDAIHGANYTLNATLFPQAISMAATFNPDLSFKAGEITAREVRVSGLKWNFSPVMDIGRQPLWPRLWETYGEDVHLASVMGVNYIQGYQGSDFSRNDKGPTCLKHYVGYSFPFNGKDRTPAYISDRMMREYFLPSFAAGIKAGAPTIMVNSAEVDGIPGHANYHYLTEILRGELGFKGFTVSDWEDIKRLYTRDKLAASEREAVKMAVMAGVDMSMVPFDYSFYEHLLDLAKQGEVPQVRIDEAVSRILRVKLQSGLFEKQQPLPVEGNFATPKAQATNLQAAREAIILAKNERQILPLKRDAKVLVSGPTADLLSVMNGGWTITWQGAQEELYPKDKMTVLEALQNKSGDRITYLGNKDFDSPIDLQQLQNLAASNDVILLCLGEKTYTETLGNIESLALDANQTKLAQTALNTGKPVVLLMLGGRPRIITALAEQAQAVLLGFLPGMEGGQAIADILYGDVNPSGKLPISYPRDTHGFTWYDYKPIENYESNTYNPLYPFGHGLSYTRFESRNLKIAKDKYQRYEPIEISVEVHNSGQRAGQESVLLYLRDEAASVSRPNKQLKAFQKVLLQPDESKTLKFTLHDEDLSFIGVDLKRRVEAGNFTVFVGNEQARFTLE